MNRTYATKLYLDRILWRDLATNYRFNLADKVFEQLDSLIKHVEEQDHWDKALLVDLLQALMKDVMYVDEPPDWRVAAARERGEEWVFRGGMPDYVVGERVMEQREVAFPVAAESRWAPQGFGRLADYQYEANFSEQRETSASMEEGPEPDHANHANAGTPDEKDANDEDIGYASDACESCGWSRKEWREISSNASHSSVSSVTMDEPYDCSTDWLVGKPVEITKGRFKHHWALVVGVTKVKTMVRICSNNKHYAVWRKDLRVLEADEYRELDQTWMP